MTGVTDVAIAVVLGGALGTGGLLLLVLMPRWGAPGLERRIAPYIRDVTDPQGVTPLVGVSMPSVIWDRVQAGSAVFGGASDAVGRRLRQAGRRADEQGVAAYRARRLIWMLGGLVLGGLVTVGLVLSGRFSTPAVVVPVVAAAVGAVGCDALLARAARARVARVQEELPTVLEFLALCLSAGEGILDSLRRVGQVGAGELTAEIRAAVLAVGTGSTLAESLTAMARGLDIPALTRAVDHIVAALDRGAPLAHVLQAQAADAREDAKRALIEQAGRKEILMLLPLVFLILPLSVLFAVFPGVFMLRLGIG
ncbi:type II secretion protein F [Microbacterium sp. SYP-A9085]|uniref:type II secretion system F family protein n=1 Tax=Microbacterium sp. SYP-A9085 TaxID=2664454 RepID=UPI00129BF672|nr:type II secretion system F family protein [Microbacterium sp. SYP-A9085]MRH29661.1 type II secretion protein F [Microbacterium sp. SYP-A9085]